MERRKFVTAIGSLAAGSAAVMGSGAFSYARAERDITVETSGDANAYLGLESTSAYAGTDNGKLKLDFSGGIDGQNGEGLNKDADTRFDDVFKITNNGTNDIDEISFHDERGESSYYDTPAATWYYSWGPTNGTWDVEGEVNEDNPPLNTGSEMYIHVIFNLTENSKDDLPDHLGITAEASDD